MLRNPYYVYGEDSVALPHHLNVGQFFLETMWPLKNKVALVNAATHEKQTYREMAVDAMSIAISLVRMGVKKGDVIAINSENRQEYFSVLIGILCTGAIATATNVSYTKDELIHVLEISKPKLMFCSPNAHKTHANTYKKLPYLKNIILFGTVRQDNVLLYTDLFKPKQSVNLILDTFEVVDVMGQTDTAIILYSSGTTGLPKGVMLTHLNILTTCALPSSVDPDESSLYITPWYHTMGMMGVLRIFSSGGTGTYLPKFDPDLYMQTIERYRIVQLIVAPTVLVAVCKSQARYDVSTVRFVYSGAAPLRENTINDAKKRFPNLQAVLQGYGMTESTLAITRNTHKDKSASKMGGVGRVVCGSVLKVVDIETGKPLGPNKQGEICIKGPLIMKGYIGKDKREDFDSEGFYKTGDIGYYDDEKSFFIVDRIKELIKYKGYQVPPAEIEALLLQHPGIKDAGVVGVTDETGEEVPLAFIALQTGYSLTEEEIKTFVADKLSNHKRLRGGVRFLDEIPRNPSGKILRRQLREMIKIKSKL